MSSQFALFEQDVSPSLPTGMRYIEAIISEKEELTLPSFIAALPLQPFEFTGGYKGTAASSLLGRATTTPRIASLKHRLSQQSCCLSAKK